MYAVQIQPAQSEVGALKEGGSFPLQKYKSRRVRLITCAVAYSTSALRYLYCMRVEAAAVVVDAGGVRRDSVPQQRPSARATCHAIA